MNTYIVKRIVSTKQAARARRTSTLRPMLTSARPPTQAWEVARTVVAQPPIAAKWFGRVFRSCVRLCGGSCVVRVTCVLLKYKTGQLGSDYAYVSPLCVSPTLAPNPQPAGGVG